MTGDDDWVDEDMCPECKTTRATNPKLLMRYSTCCGYQICSACVAGYFRFKTKIDCPGCALRTSEKEYDSVNLSGQLFNREAVVRREVHKKLCMVRADFDTLRLYNDYLEVMTDIVYDLLHGDAEEKKQAEARTREFYETHKESVDNNISRMISEQRDAAAFESARGGGGGGGVTMMEDDEKQEAQPVPSVMGGGLQYMALPLPEGESFVVLATEDPRTAQRREKARVQARRESWGKSETDLACLQVQERNEKEMRMRAGGFKAGYYTLRLKQQAFALFLD